MILIGNGHPAEPSLSLLVTQTFVCFPLRVSRICEGVVTNRYVSLFW